jgi:hypothetical protein
MIKKYRNHSPTPLVKFLEITKVDKIKALWEIRG